MNIKTWFFIFFVFSGFCSLLNEVVWTRLAMAAYGVTAVTVAMVLSLFMLGLALGSWMAGRFCDPDRNHSVRAELLAYSTCELLIGAGALAVPRLLVSGRNILVHSHATWASPSYTMMSGACIAMAFLPWTFCMGATLPLGMSILEKTTLPSSRGFSFLYLANTLGAAMGCLASAAVFIELLGFRRTAQIAATLNALIALASATLAGRPQPSTVSSRPMTTGPTPGETSCSALILVMLGMMGLASLAMEVLWFRLYTPFLNNFVYTFAAILGVYLASSYAGSHIYRARISRPIFHSIEHAWIAFGLACSLTLFFTDPRIHLGNDFLRIVGIIPACVLMGMITPQMVDIWSGGNPKRAGSAYALNVVGCIVGPLAAGFFLIPFLGERAAVFLLSLLPLGMAIIWRFLQNYDMWHRNFARASWSNKKISDRSLLFAGFFISMAFFLLFRTSYDVFEQDHPEARTVRDYTATTTALGNEYQRRLLVNGCGMTTLHPVCKVMVHLPLAMRGEKPRKILIICFGMGTSFRSALSWGAETTTVELVPGVYRLFSFFHKNADELVRRHGNKMFVDDGRRFLERTHERYDLIVIDPPPPVEGVGSSLLYSREFLALARDHLTPNGVLSHWLPQFGGDHATDAAIIKSLHEVFPYLWIFGALDNLGHHFLAAQNPLPEPNFRDMLARMPNKALKDLLEWNGDDPINPLETTLSSQAPAQDIIARVSKMPTPMLDDDHPVNEYFLLRKTGWISR